MTEYPENLREKSEQIIQWLKNHQNEIGSVLEYDLKKNPLHIFDLSSNSDFLAKMENPSNVEEFSKHVFQALVAAETPVGIGKYNESRQLYTSDQFQSCDSDESRTIHIGMDLFAEAGTPILAPLDAKIHSFQNNDLPLDYGPCIILEHETENGILFYTLYGHLSLDSLDGKNPGQYIKKGDPFAWIGNFPVNGGWAPHLHFQIMTDMMDWKGNFPGVAFPSQLDTWLKLCINPNLILQIPELELKEE